MFAPPITMNSAVSPQIISVAKENVPYTPFGALWVPNTSKFVVLGENPRRTGTLSVYQLEFDNNKNNSDSGEKLKPKQREVLRRLSHVTKDYGFKCGTFGHSFDRKGVSSQSLATGDFEGTLNIWDLEKLNKPTFEIKEAHSKIINAIDGISGKHGAAELVTGSRDGTVKVWDPRTDQCVTELKPQTSNQARDCWSVCFGNSHNAQNRMIAAGYDNGDVKILDLRTNKVFYETNVQNGVCCVEFDRKDIKLNKLVVTSLESQYRVYDLKTKHIAQGFAWSNVDALQITQSTNEQATDASKEKKGSKGTTIWNCRHLPQNRDVWITCLGSGAVAIWKYSYPEKRYVEDQKGHRKGVMGEVQLLSDQMLSTLSTQPIVSWDWNRDKTGLAVMASLDQTVQVVVVTKLNKL